MKTAAIISLTAVMAIACTHSTLSSRSETSATHVSSPQQSPFGRDQVDQLIRSLAAVGIGVYHVGESGPEVPVAGIISPMRLTDDQAAAAALGVWAHAGISGRTLDQLIPAIALAPGAPQLPTAAVIAGWASAADTPDAQLARTLMGGQNWPSFESVVYPWVVLALFASDVTSRAVLATGTYQAVPAAYVRPVAEASAGGICTGTLDFINDTIGRVFNAIGHVDSGSNVFSKLFGGLAGQILDGITSLGVAVINRAIDAVRTFVVDGVEIVVGPFLNLIATLAGTVAVATQVGQLLQPWAGKLVPDPVRNAKGVAAGMPGQVHLTVTTTSGPTGDWPPAIQDCAQSVHVSLPPLRPHGGRLRWNVDDQAPRPLATMTSADHTLSATGTATMRYLTAVEDAETAKGQERPGFVLPEVTVQRTDLDELTNKLAVLLTDAIPAVPQSIKTVLANQLSDELNRARERLGIVTKEQQVQTTLVVTYHTPGKSERTGSCPASPAGSYAGTVTMSGTVTTARLDIHETGAGSAVMTVSPNGRLGGSWTATARTDGSGTEDDGTPVEVHVTVTDRDGAFGGTLQHATVSGSASESGFLHVGAITINGPIVSDLSFNTPITLAVCAPRITVRYALPFQVGRTTLDATVQFDLTRR